MTYRTFEEMDKALDDLKKRITELERREVIPKSFPDFFAPAPTIPEPLTKFWCCEKCGWQFESGKAYGMVCSTLDCPSGLGPIVC